MKLIDSHAHLNDEKFDDLEDVIARACEKGVEKIVCSSADINSSSLAVLLSKKFKQVFANVGVHPENVENFDDKTLNEIEKLAKQPKVIAIGEIGLDFHFSDQNKNLQKEVFKKQIQLANKLGLPVVVHSRDAMGDTIEILTENPPQKSSLLHCFSGSVESAKILMKLGFSFSFGGVVTFANAKNVIEVVKNLPIEKILLETDCPYMTPVPFRGQRNEPKNVIYVADQIARIKNLTLEEVARQTSQNAERLFGI